MSAGDAPGIYEFRMPSLGADMEAGTLLEWRVRPGDVVARGDIVALVDTEKAEIEVEIFAAGQIEELLVPEGAEVPVGTPLARVRTGVAAPVAAAPEPAPATPLAAFVPPPVATRPAAPTTAGATPAARGPAAPAPRRPASIAARAAARPRVEPPAPSRGAPRPGAPVGPTGAPTARPTPQRPAASPSARRRARELGIDLDAVTPSGPSGAIVRADVEAAARAAAAAAARAAEAEAAAPPPREGAPSPRRLAQPPPSTSVAPAAAAEASSAARQPRRPSGLRRALAAAMERSNREIPHYYLATDVDLQQARTWLEETNRQRPVTERILPAALFLKAVARAAREVPEMNGFWIDGAFCAADRVHLGIAVSRREGEVVVPAIHDVDTLPLGDLMTAVRDLVRRARAGSLRSSELTDTTLTVTNVGDLGVETVLGVIYPPQVALVGIGRVTDRPRAVGGMLAVRPAATVTLAADHRASDGYRGARFLAAIDSKLQTPEAL